MANNSHSALLPDRRIVQFRKEHGAFKRPEELMSVKGIGEKSFAQLRPYLSVAAK